MIIFPQTPQLGEFPGAGFYWCPTHSRALKSLQDMVLARLPTG